MTPLQMFLDDLNRLIGPLKDCQLKTISEYWQYSVEKEVQAKLAGERARWERQKKRLEGELGCADRS